ncbi:MAG: hypothetical protein R2788_21015 [Saprospiraceae bacterium]
MHYDLTGENQDPTIYINVPNPDPDPDAIQKDILDDVEFFHMLTVDHTDGRHLNGVGTPTNNDRCEDTPFNPGHETITL